jgi:hypothetical protein
MEGPAYSLIGRKRNVIFGGPTKLVPISTMGGIVF